MTSVSDEVGHHPLQPFDLGVSVMLVLSTRVEQFVNGLYLNLPDCHHLATNDNFI